MSNFKVGDEAVCVRPIDPLIKDLIYVITDVAVCANGWESVSFGIVCQCSLPCTCPCCGQDLVTINEYYCNADRFRKVERTRHHSKHTIRNQQVLKRLATLPQVTERIEIPVRKQEGAEA